jgi:hypothetical protein
MIYDVMLYCILTIVVCVVISCVFDTNEPWWSIVALAIAIFMIAGLFGLLNFIFSSRAPLKEYAQELHTQMPSLKGKLICDDDTLTFTGTQDVTFKWKDSSYQIAYPISTEVSEIGTACRLKIKPEIPDVVTKLEDQSKEATKAIEAMLVSQVIPKDTTSEQKQILNRLLMTLNPVANQKVTVFSTEGPKDAKLKVKEPPSRETTATEIRAKPAAAKNVVTKEKTPSKATEPMELSNQDLQRNISAQ